MKPSAPSVTLVAVSSVCIEQTLYAMQRSAAAMSFGRVLLLTSEPVTAPAGIEVQPIRRLSSLDEYSAFIIRDLHRYLTTEHCLIVQWDGFVIDSRKWSAEFLQFDYVGAPFKRSARDPRYACDDHGNFYAVGNGGFSLRSTRLLRAPTELDLQRPAWSRSSNEDGFFCVEHRRTLEGLGLRWAPPELAARFSNESGLRSAAFFRSTFGFHGPRLLQRHHWARKVGLSGY